MYTYIDTAARVLYKNIEHNNDILIPRQDWKSTLITD